MDSSLTEIVKQILPLASHFSIVQRFVEEKMGFDYGQVNNALAEAINALITDYTVVFSIKQAFFFTTSCISVVYCTIGNGISNG